MADAAEHPAGPGATDPALVRRDATSDEFKAMAHPLRLRILRLCLHEALTNKQLADRLEQDAATTLHHVRTLCRTGFLRAEPLRTGRRGALEKPYRATGKSWVLSVAGSDDRLTSALATLDALRAEIAAGPPDALLTNTRAGPHLTPDEIEELVASLQALADAYAQRPARPGTVPVGLHLTLHRLAAEPD